jgi:hypothetical protein
VETAKLGVDVPVKIDCDVLVVGGGPAGIAAAAAAGRHGARTVLLEQYGCLGGMATVGLVGPFMTSFDTEGKEQIVKGIFMELVRRMIAEGGALDPADVPAGTDYVSFIHEAHHNSTPFDPEAMKYAAMELVLDAGVDVRLHASVVKVQTSDRRIESLLFAEKGGLSLARARVIVDATGDGDVGALAGNPFAKGRAGDGKLQPASLFLRIAGVDDGKVAAWAAAHMGPGKRLFEALVDQARKDGKFPRNCPRESVGLYRQPRRGEWRVNTSRILDIDGSDPESLTRAEIEGHRQARELVRFFNEYCPGLEKAYMVDTGFQVGIRETRRIEGLYTLTRADVENARRFDDGIARYSFFMDIHNPTGGGQETHERLFIKGGHFFDIPYRCLVASRVANLLVSGRCISADHQANGAIRVMPPCFATGQAAGTAAAMAVRGGVAPADVDVSGLRRALSADGCIV